MKVLFAFCVALFGLLLAFVLFYVPYSIERSNPKIPTGSYEASAIISSEAEASDVSLEESRCESEEISEDESSEYSSEIDASEEVSENLEEKDCITGFVKSTFAIDPYLNDKEVIIESDGEVIKINAENSALEKYLFCEVKIYGQSSKDGFVPEYVTPINPSNALVFTLDNITMGKNGDFTVAVDGQKHSVKAENIENIYINGEKYPSSKLGDALSLIKKRKCHIVLSSSTGKTDMYITGKYERKITNVFEYEGETTLYFDRYDNDISYPLVLSDSSKKYYMENGESFAPGSVISISFDINGDFKNSSYYVIKKVTGYVSGTVDQYDEKRGYLIKNKYYKASDDVKLEIGKKYRIMLDSFGDLLPYYDELTSDNLINCDNMKNRTVDGLKIDYDDGAIHIYGVSKLTQEIDITEAIDTSGMVIGEKYVFSADSDIKEGSADLFLSGNTYFGFTIAEFENTLDSSHKIESVVFTYRERFDEQVIRMRVNEGDEIDLVIFPELLKYSTLIDDASQGTASDIQKISLDGYDGKFRICIASDIHIGESDTILERAGLTGDQRMQLFIDAFNAENEKDPYDALIITGDIAESIRYIDWWKNKYADKFDLPVYLTKGNHDPYTEEDFFKKTGSHAQYAFDLGPFHIIMLDMYENIADYKQSTKMYSPLSESDWDFINSEIVNAGGKPVMIIGHYFDPDIEKRFYSFLEQNDQVIGVIQGHTHAWSNEIHPTYFKLTTNSFFDTTHAWNTDINRYPDWLYGFRELEIKDGKLITRHIQPAHYYPYYKNDFPNGYPYTVKEAVLAEIVTKIGGGH